MHIRPLLTATLLVATALCVSPFVRAQPADSKDSVSEEAPLHVESSTLRVGIKFKIEGSVFTRRITRFTLTEIEPDSIAEKAGLKAGDRVITWNGVKIIGEKSTVLNQLNTESKDNELRIVLEIKRKGERENRVVDLVLKNFEGSASINNRPTPEHGQKSK